MKDSFLEKVKINIENLQEDFQKQPSLFFQYGEELALADAAERNAKLNLETIEATKFLFYKKEFEDKKEKYNNDILNSCVKTDVEYIETYKKYIEAQKSKLLAKMKVDAFMQRKDMLIQLGANMRAEMNNFIQ